MEKTKKEDRIKRELTVGEVSKRTGVAISALHFYEQKGLISSRRNSGNQRRYNRDVLRRVSVIKVAQSLGLSLSSIKRALSTLPKNKIATEDDWSRLSDRWRDDLNARIEKLIQLRDQLNYCIGCGCLSMKACPLRNPWDRLAKEGPGPRLLE